MKLTQDTTPALVAGTLYDTGILVATAFFYLNAGWSYDPQTESSEDGRTRCAQSLALAEFQALSRGWSFQWELDGMTNREWTDEGEETATWQCTARDENGEVRGALCGIDFASGEPWGDPYRRVVEAELALEPGISRR